MPSDHKHSKSSNHSGEVPSAVKDFVFDLCEATRRSCRLEDVQKLYESRFREVSEQFYNNAHWPAVAAIAPEANNDDFFLTLYKEMTFRYLSAKSKPTLNDQLASWSTYRHLFDLITKTPDSEFCISTQWIYDITQEFAYQFQGFCQFRCLHGHQTSDHARVLQENRDAWNFPEVMAILHQVVAVGKTRPVVAGEKLSVIQQFGYFASIELARLECLVGDYGSSLASVSHIKLFDRSELFVSLPICYFNVYYHIGVCYMMMKRFDDALDVFADVVLNVIRMLRPGAAAQLRNGVEASLRRMLEKAQGVTAMLITIKPHHRVEDLVRDSVETKFGEKMRRLQTGDRAAATELFLASCPKFISPAAAPETGRSGADAQHLAISHQCNVLVTEMLQHVPFLKLRSLLSLYASIDVTKLARFLEVSDAELICTLLSFKNKQLQGVSNKASSSKVISDVHFYIDGGVLNVDSSLTLSDLTAANEKHFLAGTKKNSEIMGYLNKNFRKLHDSNQEKNKNM